MRAAPDVADHDAAIAVRLTNNRSSPSKSSVRQHLGQPLHVIVRAVGRGGQQDLDVAVDQLLAQLPGGGERGERDDDSADPRGRQHADDERRAVRVQQSDMGALAGAEGDEPAGQLRRATVGLGVTDAFAVADEQRVISLARAPARAGSRRRWGSHWAWSPRARTASLK